jgi:hypothetical protein
MRLVALNRPRLEPWAAAYPLSTDQARMLLDRGFHLLDAEQLDPPTELLFEITDAGGGTGILHRRRRSGGVARMVRRPPEDPAALRELAALNVDAIAGGSPPSPPRRACRVRRFWFVLHNLGLVLFSPLAARLAPLVDDEQWQRGSCRSAATRRPLGSGGRRGQRHLLCEACHFVWTFPRLKCPLCATRNGQAQGAGVGRSTVRTGWTSARHCHGYVKTIDYRKADPHQAMLAAR